LIISATTAYYSILFASDEIRILVERGPDVSVDVTGRRILFAGTQKLVFINGGNRAAVINRLGVVFARAAPHRTLLNQCSGGANVELYTDMAPFVIKPGEIIQVEAKISQKQGQPVEGLPETRAVPFKEVIPEKGDRVQICLRIALATVEDYREALPVVLFDGNVKLEAEYVTFELPGIGLRGPSYKPYILLHQSRSFDRIISYVRGAN
jgi:hypothetical protein